MKREKVLIYALLIMFGLGFSQCSKDDEIDSNETGQVSVSITDAPSDDANIQGTFVTVSELKIDGETVEGFTKQTVEISAYQEGNAKLLFNDEVEARSYNSISLVFDYESDASGNSPGCYVLTEENEKHNLAATGESKGEITFTKSFEVMAASQSSFIIDFDLRKSIVRDTESSTSSEYKFVTSAEMQNSLRLVEENKCGEISGTVNSTFNLNDETYVFMYKKGEYNASVENQVQGSSNVRFANAVGSAMVKQDGSYKLSFLEEGDYEIHLAAYEQSSGNKSIYKSMVDASSTISGLLLNNISVSAESQVQLNIETTGLF